MFNGSLVHPVATNNLELFVKKCQQIDGHPHKGSAMQFDIARYTEPFCGNSQNVTIRSDMKMFCRLFVKIFRLHEEMQLFFRI